VTDLEAHRRRDVLPDRTVDPSELCCNAIISRPAHDEMYLSVARFNYVRHRVIEFSQETGEIQWFVEM
jgi:hypothetical protein